MWRSHFPRPAFTCAPAGATCSHACARMPRDIWPRALRMLRRASMQIHACMRTPNWHAGPHCALGGVSPVKFGEKDREFGPMLQAQSHYFGPPCPFECRGIIRWSSADRPTYSQGIQRRSPAKMELAMTIIYWIYKQVSMKKISPGSFIIQKLIELMEIIFVKYTCNNFSSK